MTGVADGFLAPPPRPPNPYRDPSWDRPYPDHDHDRDPVDRDRAVDDDRTDDDTDGGGRLSGVI